MKKNVSGLFVITLISLGLNFCQIYANSLSHSEDYDLLKSTLKLQQIQSNYTTRIFGYTNDALVIEFKHGNNADGKLNFTVVIITPHYGYATVNQTYFKPYNLSQNKFLDPQYLHSDLAIMWDNYILSVAPGAFERKLQLHFSANIYPVRGLQPGTGFGTHIGVIGVWIVFYDAQTQAVIPKIVELSVGVEYMA